MIIVSKPVKKEDLTFAVFEPGSSTLDILLKDIYKRAISLNSWHV